MNEKTLLKSIVLLFMHLGFVTISAQEAYFVIQDKTMTFYYDEDWSERGGRFVGVGQNNILGWGAVKKAVFDSSFASYRPKNLSHFFDDCFSLETIEGLEYLNTSEVTNMEWMFYNCEHLLSLDLSHFDTHNVKNMACMFNDCVRLTSLDLSSFNTQNVESMHMMFMDCEGLKSLNVSSFNTEKVVNMSKMFYCCKNLTTLDVSNFNTKNVGFMDRMFSCCTKLTTLDVSSFNTEKVIDMQGMFSSCIKLETIFCNDTWGCNNTWRSYGSEVIFLYCRSLKGAIPYDETKTDVTYANPDTGYFTRTNGTSIPTLHKGKELQNEDIWYNLNGQRLSQPKKGINIIGGKKVVVK